PPLAHAVPSDGRTLLFNLDTSIKIVAAGGTGEPRKLTTLRQKLDELVPTRDGRFLVAHRMQDQRDEIVVISTSDGSERVLTVGHHPFPSLDGKRVLFGAPDDPPRLLAVPIDGGAPALVADLPGPLVF